jgi:hypothetical protein
VREPAPSPILRLRATPQNAPLVRFTLLHHSPITLTQRPGGQLPEIAGLRTGGAPGTLSLPVEIHRILIPPSQQVGSITVSPDPSPVRLAAPTPQVQPPAVKDVPYPDKLRPRPAARERLTLARTGIFPAEQVRLQSVDQHPWGALATIELWPVQYDYDAKEYVYHPNLAYDLSTMPTSAPASDTLFPGVTNRDQASMLTSLLRGGGVSVIGGPETWTVNPAATISSAPAGMVIITDDTLWNGSNLATAPILSSSPITKGAAPPQNSFGNGLIAEFERLAYWKSARGMRTKVMPVWKIMDLYTAGDLAPFLPGPALDLAEVIRAFIQYAVKHWQTNFVLIGGDQTIVPMRQVLGQRDPDYFLSSSSGYQNGLNNVAVLPGPPGQWIAKIWGPVTAGDLAENAQPITSSFSLVCTTSGVLLPYSPTGTGERGWFFTSPYQFDTQTTGFTVQGQPGAKGTLAVIAFGGPEIQDGNFGWIWPGRATQTDHYYSDMTRAPGGSHDFDANGNLLLGQIEPIAESSEIPIDGMQVTGSVYVGRAPVTNATDARNFVDKVIGYEQVRAIDAPPIDPNYLHELILYADNWAHPWNWAQAAGTGSTPGVGDFVWSGPDVLIQLGNDGVDGKGNPTGLAADLAKADLLQPLPYSVQLLFDASGETIDIPYDPSGGNTPCWFFCDANYNRLPPNAGTLGTAYVRIAGAPIDFDTIFWQYESLDDGSAQKEQLHTAWKAWFPSLGDVRRIYRDAPDLPDQDIESMLTETANAALDQGSHFFSITGHGNVQCVSYIGNRTCGNAGRPYIMYAHSCLTADPDAQPSLGASMVTQTNGALAYVGYARCCNTADAVADYELGFWCGVAQTRRLGPPIALHLNSSGWEQFDHIFQMTLYGDPEMPVWIAPPRRLTVEFGQSVEPSGPGIGCQYVWASVTDDQGQPVPGLLVTAIQGWQNSLTDPAAYVTATTDDTGYAGLLLSTAITDAVRVVVSTPPTGMSALYAPVIQDYAPQRGSA